MNAGRPPHGASHRQQHRLMDGRGGSTGRFVDLELVHHARDLTIAFAAKRSRTNGAARQSRHKTCNGVPSSSLATGDG